jgi:hypothetical protein
MAATAGTGVKPNEPAAIPSDVARAITTFFIEVSVEWCRPRDTP